MNNVTNKTWSCKGVIVFGLLMGLALTGAARATPHDVKNPMDADLDAAGYNIFDVNDLDVVGDVNVTGIITTADIITKGPWVDVCAYASFSAAIDAIDTDEVTLLIPDSQTVDVDKTVESNVTLWFLRGGELNISDGKTVTINGPVKAGLHKIFAGSGDVSFGSGCFRQVYPQWWDAKGDGSTDDTAALQAAFDSIADGQKIVIPPGTYDFNDTLTLDNDNAILDCQGRLMWTKATDGTAVQVGTSAHHTFRIRAFLRLYNADITSDAWDVNSIGVQITNTYESNITIEECKYFQIGLQLYGCPGEGVAYNQFTLGTLEDNKVGIDVKPDNDGVNYGWVNDNILYGGRFGYHISRDSFAGSRFINIPHDPCNTPYNNIFYSPSFECDFEWAPNYDPNEQPDYFVYCNGRHNAIIQPYCEGTPSSGYNVCFDVNSSYNVWEAGRPRNIEECLDDGNRNRIETGITKKWGQLTQDAYGNITGTSFIIGGNTLDTNEWAFLDGLDQSLATTDSPIFASGVTIGTLTLADGSITDSSGDIDFGNENLTTTGDIITTGYGKFGYKGVYVYDPLDEQHLAIRASAGSLGASDRSLDINMNDATHTINIAGDTTLSDWFNQSVKTGASPTFVDISADTFNEIGILHPSANVMIISAGTTALYVNHDCIINQDLSFISSPTFASLTLTDNLVVNANIGVSGDVDLLQLAADELTVNGDAIVTSGLTVNTTDLVVDAVNRRVGIRTAWPTAKLDVNSDIIRLRTAKTPSSASDTGNAGDICWDANYIYICVATDTWKRAAISSW